MTVTRSFRDTVQTRAAADPDYRYGLLTESMDSMLSGDLETGKALLRDYINATIGFEPLAEAVGKSPKSLMRMLGASGNPTANNLFGIISLLQEKEGVHLQTKAAS
jgi:DNA-binding phage protein